MSVENGREVMARHRIISQYTIWTIFIVVLSFTSHHLIAEDQKIHSSLPAYTPRKTRIALYPVAFYSGETGAAGGFATMLLFPGYSQQRIPTIGLLGYYTQNGQYSVKLKPSSTGARTAIASLENSSTTTALIRSTDWATIRT